MAKRQPVPDDVQRLIAMDKELCGSVGLHLRTFAKHWGRDEKTIRRDLNRLRALGQQIIQGRLWGDGDGHYYLYKPEFKGEERLGVIPAFTCNLRPQQREGLYNVRVRKMSL